MSTVGANIDEVERLTAEKIGCKYAVALSCGTAALHLAMKVAGVKRGQHVLCSSQTLDATGKPIAGRKFTVEVLTFELIPLKIQQKIKGINKGYQRITNCEKYMLVHERLQMYNIDITREEATAYGNLFKSRK